VSITQDIKKEERKLENLHHVQRLAAAMAPDPKEWEYRGEMIDSGGVSDFCSCGHPIRFIFPIYNKRTGKSIPIGSVCIEASVPYLMTVGAAGLAKSLEGCQERLKKHLSELESRKRAAAGDARFQKLKVEAEALAAWYPVLWKKVLIHASTTRQRLPFLPEYFFNGKYAALKEEPTASTPGRAASGLASRCKTFRTHAASLKANLEKAGFGRCWVDLPPAVEPEGEAKAEKTSPAPRTPRPKVYRLEDNPWYLQHLEGEMNFLGEGYTRSIAKAVTRSEYQGHEQPIPCGASDCNEQAFYRATVGAFICPCCDAMQMRDGTWSRRDPKSGKWHTVSKKENK
jgi:ribosomal protein L37AE/L43A